MAAKTIKLISDAGIQFVNFDLYIPEDFNQRNKIFYLEEFHLDFGYIGNISTIYPQ